LLVAISILLVGHVGVNFLDVSLVGVDDLPGFSELLLKLLDFLVLRLDAVHKALTGFGEGEVHLIGLELKITLTFGQVILFFAQVLGALLESILLQTGFGLHKSLADFFELTAVLVDLNLEVLVIGLQLFVVIALLGVEVVQLGLVGVVDVLNLLLVTLELILHITLLRE